MSLVNVFYGIIIAAIFAIWPIIGKNTGLSGGWVITIVSSGTLLTAMLFSINDLSVMPTLLNKANILLALAGIFNGFACWLYTNRLSKIDIEYTGNLIAVITVGMVLFTPVFHLLINGGVPSSRQILGFTLAACSVYFLTT